MIYALISDKSKHVQKSEVFYDEHTFFFQRGRQVFWMLLAVYIAGYHGSGEFEELQGDGR